MEQQEIILPHKPFSLYAEKLHTKKQNFQGRKEPLRCQKITKMFSALVAKTQQHLPKNCLHSCFEREKYTELARQKRENIKDFFFFFLSCKIMVPTNEFCDRFATVGFNANMITYLTQELYIFIKLVCLILPIYNWYLVE